MTSLACRLAAVALLCAALSTAQSTNKEASTAAAEATTAAPAVCTSGHRKVDPGPCGGNCYCLGGRWVCPESDCGRSNSLQNLRSMEPLPLVRNKRETDDANTIVYAERCVPHDHFQDGCHFCICPTSGIRSQASCTFGSCPPPASPVSHTARPPRPAATTATTAATTNAAPATTAAAGDAFDDFDASDAPAAPLLTTLPAPRPCDENEVGTAPDCVAVPLDGERCAPGITYMDECNTCICSQDGIKAHASCTFKVCPK